MEKPTQEQMGKTHIGRSKSVVWDCGSTLYDSFELKSFKRQLDSAITSRTLSMPHLPDRRVSLATAVAAPPPPPLHPPPTAPKKPSSKISRSINRLVKSIFRPKQRSGPLFMAQEKSRDGFYVLYDNSGALTTIPEAPEMDHHFGSLSPEVNALARRTASERFTTSSIRVSCA